MVFGRAFDELDGPGIPVRGGHPLHVVLELPSRLSEGSSRALARRSLDDQAADHVRRAHHRRLCHRRGARSGRSPPRRARSVARGLDHIVVPADEPEISVLVHVGLVAGEYQPPYERLLFSSSFSVLRGRARPAAGRSRSRSCPRFVPTGHRHRHGAECTSPGPAFPWIRAWTSMHGNVPMQSTVSVWP